MSKDICVPCGDGIINVRVGAIIIKDGKVLMVGNERNDYLYSVGGRIKMGETAEEAVIREVLEETGVRMEIDRLGFIHENYFKGDSPANLGKLIYEICFYFYMKTPEDFDPLCESYTEDNRREFLEWVLPDTAKKIYPSFYRDKIFSSDASVRHIVNDER